jgi:hypothetical protein
LGLVISGLCTVQPFFHMAVTCLIHRRPKPEISAVN